MKFSVEALRNSLWKEVKKACGKPQSKVYGVSFAIPGVGDDSENGWKWYEKG
jgi:hypothetical protein